MDLQLLGRADYEATYAAMRSFTQGRAQYTMQFSHYDEVPANVAEEVKAKLA